MMNELETLRPFDAAPAAMYDDVAAERSLARLEQILAVAPERVPEMVDVPRRRRRPTVRALRLAAVAALATASVVVAVVLPGGRGAAPAFAGWTAVPAALDGAAATAVDQVCRSAIAAGQASMAAQFPKDPPATLTDPSLAIAERRGDLSVAAYLGTTHEVALLGTKHESGLCITVQRDGKPVVAQYAVLNSGWSGTKVLRGAPDPQMPFGSDESWNRGFQRGRPGELAPDAVFVQSGISEAWEGHGKFIIVEGPVGDQVAAVVLHADGYDVEATVSNGRFLAWWPATVLPSWLDGQHGDAEIPATIALTDGTVDTRPTLG